MIYYDVTKLGAAKQRSGLTRVSRRLLAELGNEVTRVAWDGGFRAADGGARIAFRPDDWLLTVELFSEAERPGLREFVARRPCRLAAMFHDAIPLRFPHITWPQSVQRHPDYLKLLAGFDIVLAISEASRRDLEGFWRWQGAEVRARTGTIVLGADFDNTPRIVAERPGSAPPGAATGGRPALLCVGIVEPRKNQALLLDVGERLWESGLDFSLDVVGRVNPHFGKPIERRMRDLQAREPRFRHHAAADDRELARRYAGARAVVFPTIAEGCGLPLLEALWRGVPCVGSDLPVLRENADAGGCLLADLGLSVDWQAKLRDVLTDDALHARLRREAQTRDLPRWRDTAAAVRAALG